MRSPSDIGPCCHAYLRELVARLRVLLGDDLVGVYAGGSIALGDFDPGRSDIDVAAVCRLPVDPPTKRAIVEAVRHESLPCPARGLELVLYAERDVRTPSTAAAFELNLNTGAGMAFRADLAPAGEHHWFAIDRSILAAHGVALLGPSAAEALAPPARGPLLGVLAQSVRWHRVSGASPRDAVLNACRALRYAREGVWSSKRAAGEWALATALPPPDDPALVPGFLQAVERELGKAARRARP